MSISREQAHDILMKYMKGEAYILMRLKRL